MSSNASLGNATASARGAYAYGVLPGAAAGDPASFQAGAMQQQAQAAQGLPAAPAATRPLTFSIQTSEWAA